MDINNESGKKDIDEGISVGLFSYPLLMASDILTPNATHVPVGKDQQQHLEITRDIAEKFNRKYGNFFNVPEAVIKEQKTVLGTDGRKMSKSYNNIIPLLAEEKELRKSVMKIVTNSQEPGEKKDWKENTLFSIYSSFASKEQIEDMKQMFNDGVGWGDAKQMVFEDLNSLFTPIREKYLELNSNQKYIEDVLRSGADKVRKETLPLIKEVKRLVGINNL
jgi:tryptophanyl-tRNA synthetase